MEPGAKLGAHELLLFADALNERLEPLKRLVAARPQLGSRAARLGGLHGKQVALDAAQHRAALRIQLAQPALAHRRLRWRQRAAHAQLVQVHPARRPASLSPLCWCKYALAGARRLETPGTKTTQGLQQRDEVGARRRGT